MHPNSKKDDHALVNTDAAVPIPGEGRVDPLGNTHPPGDPPPACSPMQQPINASDPGNSSLTAASALSPLPHLLTKLQRESDDLRVKLLESEQKCVYLSNRILHLEDDVKDYEYRVKRELQWWKRKCFTLAQRLAGEVLNGVSLPTIVDTDCFLSLSPHSSFPCNAEYVSCQTDTVKGDGEMIRGWGNLKDNNGVCYLRSGDRGGTSYQQPSPLLRSGTGFPSSSARRANRKDKRSNHYTDHIDRVGERNESSTRHSSSSSQKNSISLSDESREGYEDDHRRQEFPPGCTLHGDALWSSRLGVSEQHQEPPPSQRSSLLQGVRSAGDTRQWKPQGHRLPMGTSRTGLSAPGGTNSLVIFLLRSQREERLFAMDLLEGMLKDLRLPEHEDHDFARGRKGRKEDETRRSSIPTKKPDWEASSLSSSRVGSSSTGVPSTLWAETSRSRLCSLLARVSLGMRLAEAHWTWRLGCWSGEVKKQITALEELEETIVEGPLRVLYEAFPIQTASSGESFSFCSTPPPSASAGQENRSGEENHAEPEVSTSTTPMTTGPSPHKRTTPNFRHKETVLGTREGATEGGDRKGSLPFSCHGSRAHSLTHFPSSSTLLFSFRKSLSLAQNNANGDGKSGYNRFCRDENTVRDAREGLRSSSRHHDGDSSLSSSSSLASMHWCMDVLKACVLGVRSVREQLLEFYHTLGEQPPLLDCSRTVTEDKDEGTSRSPEFSISPDLTRTEATSISPTSSSCLSLLPFARQVATEGSRRVGIEEVVATSPQKKLPSLQEPLYNRLSVELMMLEQRSLALHEKLFRRLERDDRIRLNLLAQLQHEMQQILRENAALWIKLCQTQDDASAERSESLDKNKTKKKIPLHLQFPQDEKRSGAFPSTHRQWSSSIPLCASHRGRVTPERMNSRHTKTTCVPRHRSAHSHNFPCRGKGRERKKKEGEREWEEVDRNPHDVHHLDTSSVSSMRSSSDSSLEDSNAEDLRSAGSLDTMSLSGRHDEQPRESCPPHRISTRKSFSSVDRGKRKMKRVRRICSKEYKTRRNQHTSGTETCLFLERDKRGREDAHCASSSLERKSGLTRGEEVASPPSSGRRRASTRDSCTLYSSSGVDSVGKESYEEDEDAQPVRGSLAPSQKKQVCCSRETNRRIHYHKRHIHQWSEAPRKHGKKKSTSKEPRETTRANRPLPPPPSPPPALASLHHSYPSVPRAHLTESFRAPLCCTQDERAVLYTMVNTEGKKEKAEEEEEGQQEKGASNPTSHDDDDVGRRKLYSVATAVGATRPAGSDGPDGAQRVEGGHNRWRRAQEEVRLGVRGREGGWGRHLHTPISLTPPFHLSNSFLGNWEAENDRRPLGKCARASSMDGQREEENVKGKQGEGKEGEMAKRKRRTVLLEEKVYVLPSNRNSQSFFFSGVTGGGCDTREMSKLAAHNSHRSHSRAPLISPDPFCGLGEY